MELTDEQMAALAFFRLGMTLRLEARAGAPEHRGAGVVGYSVTDTGEVWTWWQRNGSRRAILSSAPICRLSPGIAGSNGYEQVWLYEERRRLGRFVHLLVLEAFIGPRPAGQQARHLDGNERNNCRSNLAWGTPVQNCEDRDRHGTTPRGERVGSAVLDSASVAAIRAAVAAGESRGSVARRVHVSRGHVGRIVARKAWAWI